MDDQKRAFECALEKGLICDGAFGTYYAFLYSENDLPEKANLEHPERVERIHEEYISAGARFIRSNTFALGYYHSRIEGSEEQLAAAGFEIAKRTADRHSAVAAANIGFGDPECAEKAGFAMARAGARIFNFESLSELSPVGELIAKLRSEYPDVCVTVNFCVSQYGYSQAGLSAASLARSAEDSPLVDHFGFNCGIGPGHMVRMLSTLDGYSKLVCAMPNAGINTVSRSHPDFLSGIDYFAAKQRRAAEMGLKMLGGCCGTTPNHIALLKGVFDRLPEQKETERLTVHAEPKPPALTFERRNRKTVAVELVPPAGCSADKLMDAAHLLANQGADIATFPDSPSGRTRVDSILMAVKVKNETGMRVMPHLCCRDRNAIALRSSVMGAYINDVRDFLVVTGDPVPQAVRGSVKSVFNFDSVGAMRLIEELNSSELSERPVNYGGAIGISVRNFSSELERVKRKTDAGAGFFMTQPVFSDREIERLALVREKTGAKLFCGIMPLVSLRNALFTKNEIAGIDVPDEIVALYREDMTREDGELTGKDIARRIMEKTADIVDGYYFSLPFNRIYLLKGLI